MAVEASPPLNKQRQSSLRDRVAERIRDWRVVVERAWETDSAFIALGRRDDQPVFLKLMRNDVDEWRSGDILEAFDGRGVVRIYESTDGAVLLERLLPGHLLVDIVGVGGDDRATAIIADVIRSIVPRAPPAWVPTVAEWGKSFDARAARDEFRVPENLFRDAQELYLELCGSQSNPRLLHGDLHHYNVIFDADRGWLAVDPKGVVGELEFEVGAVLRNPAERPELFISPSTVERRVEELAARLPIDLGRVLAWSFAQAVLAAVWAIEDGWPVWPGCPPLALAETVRPMLRRWGWGP